MIPLDAMIGLVLLLTCSGLMLIFSLPRRDRNRPGATFRPIPALYKLRRAIGLAVEDGSRTHLSLGWSDALNPEFASALVGLNALERIAQLSSISDRPPLATSGSGPLALLSQDTLHAAYRLSLLPELYDRDRGLLAGPGAFAYAAGTLSLIRSEGISANVWVGHFGPEIALMLEAAEQKGSFSLASSDSLPGQAVLFALASEPLIGEELFAIPAYLQKGGGTYAASLRAQDVLRWILVLALLVGAGLKFVGIL